MTTAEGTKCRGEDLAAREGPWRPSPTRAHMSLLLRPGLCGIRSWTESVTCLPAEVARDWAGDRLATAAAGSRQARGWFRAPASRLT